MSMFNPFSNQQDGQYGDIYSSQADVYGNSFANPMNPANMNPGFQMDPNLLTPSYTAGYRPRYNGPQPYNQYGRVGFFSGLNTMFNPTAYEPRWGNPIDNTSQTVEGVSSRPFDSVIWAGQRVVAPMVGFGLAFQYAAKPGAALGRAVGRSFGAGVAAGMGKYMPGVVGRGLSAGLGGVGLAAGYLAAPLVIGQAAMSVAQHGVFDPYINTRRTARDLRSNMRGITFSDATGNAVTGQGLGGYESSAIAQQITQDGIQNYGFSAGEYSDIADYSARAGLLDDTKAKNIAKRIKDVSGQIKLVMALAGDPSIKAAIETIAQLHNGGAQIGTQSTQALMSLGLSSAVSGRSIQNVMNTVGSQAQYLYQANGMTPYLGQMAASNILGSFEVAKRTGLLNTSQLARMGGTEGATQASMTGQLNATQTLLSQMGLYNKYISGRGGRAGVGPGMSVTATTGQFGSDMSRDPLGTYGGMHMFSRVLGGKELDERGSLALEDQIYSILDNMAVPKGKDGKYSAEQMAGVMAGVMHMSDDEIQAYLAQRSSETDSQTYRQGLRARNAQTQKQLRQYVSTNYLYAGAVGRAVRGGMQAWRNFTGVTGEAVSEMVGLQGMFHDNVQSFQDRVQFGSTFNDGYTPEDMNRTIDRFNASSRSDRGPNTTPVTMSLLNDDDNTVFGVGQYASRLGSRIANGDTLMPKDSQRLARRINELAKQGNATAQAFINAKNKSERSRALGKLLKENKDDFSDVSGRLRGGGSNASIGNYDQFLDDVNTMGIRSESVKSEDDKQTGFMGDLADSLGEWKIPVAHRKNFLDSMNAIGQIGDLANKYVNGASQQEIVDLVKGGKYDLVKGLVGGRSDQDIVRYISDARKRSIENGTATLGGLAFAGDYNVDSFKKDPSRIQDPQQRQAFINAMRSGDEATMQNIVSKQLGYANGGQLKTEGLKGATSQDLKDASGYQQHLDAMAKENSKAYQLIASGRVDYATAQNIMNNIDTKTNNELFKSAVDKFDKAADKILNGDVGGNSDANNNGRGGEPSMSDIFWKGMRAYSDNNVRGNGSPQSNR